jgi:hypothetical protein
MAKVGGLFFPPYMSVTKGRLEVWSVASPAQVCTGFHTDHRGPADSSLKSDSYCSLASSRFHVDQLLLPLARDDIPEPLAQQ